MTPIRFTVPGLPRPKERPRFGQGRAYTPEKTRKYEEEVWWMAYGAGLRQDSLRGQFLKVTILAHLGWTLEDVLHADSDNLAKGILDGCKPAFNDAYVVELRVVKARGEPRCEVTIETIEGETL